MPKKNRPSDASRSDTGHSRPNVDGPNPSSERSTKRRGQQLPPPDAAAVLGAFHPAEFSTTFLPEPSLVFGDGRRTSDPKTGLALHKPFDLQFTGRNSTIRLGIIGTGAMIDSVHAWLEKCRTLVLPMTRCKGDHGELIQKALDPVSHAMFPGLAGAFEADFVVGDNMKITLTQAEIDSVLGQTFFEQKVTRLVELVAKRLAVLADGEQKPHVVVVALPSEVRKQCTVPSKQRTRGKKVYTLAHALRDQAAADAASGQGTLFGLTEGEKAQIAAVEADEEELSKELGVFHHALKAAAMQHDLPIQLAWQTALEGSAKVEDDATRAWNFWTGIYYKSGGIPWRATGLKPGTCYVGVSFFRDRQDGSLRTSMAQAFSDQAEGMVLRGDPFKWTQRDSRTPHLSQEMAADLMRRVIEGYAAVHDRAPTRVVLHKWQRYTDDERVGFVEAMAKAKVHSYDLVALGDRGVRFFRPGQEPVLRGTMVILGAQNALLYTRGYVPWLEEYSGMRVPRPIELVEHHGSASLRQLCEEILALTKMDWNSASFASKEPITTAFSEDVGDILAELKHGMKLKSSYRFYM